MDVSAAVARQAGQPLTIETVQLDGPQDGEVLVEIKATGICHTDAFTLSGDDPEGAFPAILGHEGAGVVVDVGKGVTTLKKGDHVIPLYTPECRECDYCLNPKTNLCQSIRSTQGQGLLPDGSTRFSSNGAPILHYMGTSTFANFTVVPEIALAKVREDAPFDKICYIGCGVTNGYGRGDEHGQGRSRGHGRHFRSWRHRAVGGYRRSDGLRIAHNRDRRQREQIRISAKAWRDGLHQSESVRQTLVALTGGGADYTFDATGNVDVMRTALEAAHKGWGESVIIGVAPAGAEISTRPFQLVTGRVWRGTAFGGARGRTDVPKIVDWYMDGKINIDDLITHTLPLDRINEGFDLMHEGKSIRSVVKF